MIPFVELGAKLLVSVVDMIPFLLEAHAGQFDNPHNDVAHLELSPLGIVVGDDLDASCRSIIIVDNDVVVVVVESIPIAFFDFRVREGIPLEVIIIA